MRIYAGADGWYDDKGNQYSTEQVKSLYEKQQEKNNGGLFDSFFSGQTTTYDQAGAIDYAVKGTGGGENTFARVRDLFNANNVVETDSDRAARLREASDILGFDDAQENTLMQGGLSNDDVMKSALALAKKKQSEPEDWEQFSVEHPATVKYLEQQKNMAVSYDDVFKLGRLEDTANQVKTHLEMMDIEEKIAELGRKYDAQNMSYNELSADQRVELNDLLTKRKELQGGIDTWSIGNVLGSLLTMKEDLPMALGMGLQGGLLGGGAGALAGGVGAVPGALTGFGAGFKIGMGASMGYRMAGTQYAENMMRADANGQYMDANSLRQGAWGAGLGMMALGTVGVGRLTSKLPMGQVYDKFLRTTSPSVLNNPEAREAAWKGYLSTLGVGLKEAAAQDVIFGGGTAALTFGANRYSEALSGLDYSNREDGTLLQNVISGMQSFAPMAIGAGIGFPVAGRLMEGALGGKKPAPMPVADGLNKVMKAVDETKTAQRSPQATREAINTVFGDTASAQDVSINARGFVKLFQEADPDNPNRVVEVAQKLGVDETTLKEAVEVDGDIRVSVGDFVSEFSLDKENSNLRAEVLKEVRDVDQLTERERGEVLNQQKEEFQSFKEEVIQRYGSDFDKGTDVYKEAERIAREFDPNAKDRDVEKTAKYLVAYAETAEKRGLLKAVGIENAAETLRMIKSQYSNEAPAESEGFGMSISPKAQLKADVEAWSKNIDAYMANNLRGKEPIKIMDTPLVLTLAGMKRLPIEIDKSIMRKVFKGKHSDEFDPDMLKKLPEKIVDPLMILRAFDENGVEEPNKRIVVVDMKSKYGSTVMVPFVMEATPTSNKIASIYGRGKPRPYDEWYTDRMNDANLLYINKKRTDHWLTTLAGAHSGSRAVSSFNFTSSIPTEVNLVNLKIANPAYYEGEGTRLASWNPSATKDADNRLVPVNMGKAIIEGYKHSNYASLTHEMTHHYTWLLENAIKSENPPESAVRDFNILREFVGGEEGKGFTEAQYEKIADAFETYAMEGKAPSMRLNGVFYKLKTWMKRLYRKFKFDGVEINDDVREVFDRMLATDEELALAEDFYQREQLFAGRDMDEKAQREYAKMLADSYEEAEKEMNKRVMAEVTPAMKEITKDVEHNLREDIAGKMQYEPVYAARMLFTAPRDSADIKAAKASALKEKIEERLDLLVKQSAQGIEKRGEVVSEHGTVTENWFVGDSMNHDWYREMFKRLGDIPSAWYEFIKDYKAKKKTLKQMPKKMREEYERIAEEQLSKGHKDSFLGDIPEDIEYVNLKEDTPAMSWIVQNGGGIRLDRQAIYERFGEGALPEKWLTDKGGYTIDEVADYVYDGKGSGDMLFQELTTKLPFAQELNKRVRLGVEEFKSQELGSIQDSLAKAVYNEKSMDAVALRAEITERKAAEMKARNEQATAEAIAEGREKQAIQNKIDKQVGEAKDAAARKAAREQRYLDAAIARGTLKKRAALDMAKKQIADTPVGELLNAKKYIALANRARNDYVRLMSKGDYDGAVEAVNRELYCQAMFKAASNAHEEVSKDMRYFARVNKRGNKMKNIPHEYNVQTDKIMANFGLLTHEPLKGLDGDIPLRVFLYGDKEQYPNYESVVDTYATPFVADFVLDGEKKPYSELTVYELRDLKNSVESIRGIGRAADKTLADGKKQSINNIVTAMIEKLGTHVQRYANASSMAESKKPFFSLTDLKKPETVLRLMDKGEENGIFVSSIYNPLKLGLDDYANRSRKIIKDVEKIMSDSGYTQREIAANKTKYYTFDFIEGGKVTHEQIMLFCMNWGNDGNKDRARYYLKTEAEKHKKQWTEQELAELDSRALLMFEKLTAKDLKLVQAVWDYLNTYADDIRRQEIECAGIDPKMVEAVPFSVMTADGQNVTLRGGYFPIRYDPNKSVRAMDLDTANDLFKKNSAVQASVSHAYTKSRSQHIDRPLLLEWSTFTDHLRNVNYDLAMRKPVRDVARILRRADLQEAIGKAFGNDTVRMLNDWLRDIASDQRDMLKVSEKVLRWTRTRMSVAYLGLRTKALFIDLPQNVVTAMWQNGGNPPKEMLKFIFSGDYKAKIDFVNQRSPMMRDKYAFMDANLSDLRQDFMGDVGIVGKLTKGRVILPSNEKIQKFAFCVDSFADGAVNYPTWIRYHEEAMARGLSDAEASLEADAKVRRQSVDTSKAGMAAIQRGSESLKLITPFYSYFNAYLNRLLYDYGMFNIKWADGQRMDAVGIAVRGVGLGVALPVMIEAIMQGYVLNNDQTKDKKKQAENIKKEMISAAISYPANTLPVVGQFVTLGVDKFMGKKNNRFELSPVESAFNTMADTFGAIGKYSDSHGDAEAEKKLVEAMAKTAAVTIPYPNILNTFALNMWDAFAKGGDITLADIVTRRRNQK